jgi:hypothetical protein
MCGIRRIREGLATFRDMLQRASHRKLELKAQKAYVFWAKQKKFNAGLMRRFEMPLRIHTYRCMTQRMEN